jgi:hypothetical protein
MRRFVLARVGESLVEDAMESSETRKSVVGGGGRDINSEISIACANKMRCTFCLYLQAS